jgi:endonuclease/exonuclease/phosphatase family metal-dependent hydrolase
MKIVTWNIQWGLGADGRVDLARIASDARGLADFDVLCLQEVSDNFPTLRGNDGRNQFAALAALFPGFAAVEGTALDVPDGSGGRRRFGNMILSRLPVGEVLRHALPWEADGTRNMPRLLLEAVIEGAAGPVRVMTTHLEYSSDLIRRAQVEAVREAHRMACDRVGRPREDGPGTYVRQPSSRAAVLTGDFNMRPEDPTRRRLSAPMPNGAPPLVDAWESINGAAPHPVSANRYDPTYGPPQCLDFVYVSADLAPRLRKIVYDQASQASDHQPVLIEIEG